MARTKRARKKKDRRVAEAAPARELPGWVAPVVFAVVTLILFRAFVFSRGMLYGGDTEALGYMARAFYADALKRGVFPLWNPYLLGGMPFLDALSAGDSLYPTAALLLFMATYRALGWKLVIHVFLAGVFTYGWTRRLGTSRVASLLAGLAYMMAPFFVTLVFPGHDGKMFVTTLTPLLFWAMEWTFARRGLLPYAAVAAVVGLVILTTHFQMAYFLFGAAGVYYAFRCVVVWRRGGGPTRAAARFGLFLAASVVGGALAGVQLVPAVRYVADFSRRTATTTAASAEENRAYAASWSLHPEELVSVLVDPEFVGNNAGGSLPGTSMPGWVTGTYWGRNFFKTNLEYVGVVVLMLAGLSFLGGRRRAERWFLAVLGTLGLLYSLGAHTPVWNLAYDLLPGVSLFRAPSMVVFLFGFAAATLLALGVDRLLEALAGDEAGWRPVSRYLWIFAGVLVLLMLLAGSGALLRFWTAVVYPDMDPSKAAALQAARPYIVRGFLLAAVFGLVVALLAWAARGGYLPRWGLVAGLALVLALDLGRVDAPFIQVVDPARVRRPDPNIDVLVSREAKEPPFRLWQIANSQDVGPAVFGIELVGGHHPNDLAPYRELIGQQGGGQAQNLFNQNVARLLNVRYALWPTLQQGQELQGLPKVSESKLQDGRVYETLYAYPGLPRARLVGAAEVVPYDRQVARILEPGFDPDTVAILDEAPPLQLPGHAVDGDVTWEERGLNRQRLRVRTSTPALLVVADNWYPAWHATVDGGPAPVLRAYHTLRAVPVPAGDHEVTLAYHSAVVRSGLWLSVGALLLLVVVALGARFVTPGREAEASDGERPGDGG